MISWLKRDWPWVLGLPLWIGLTHMLPARFNRWWIWPVSGAVGGLLIRALDKHVINRKPGDRLS